MTGRKSRVVEGVLQPEISKSDSNQGEANDGYRTGDECVGKLGSNVVDVIRRSRHGRYDGR